MFHSWLSRCSSDLSVGELRGILHPRSKSVDTSARANKCGVICVVIDVDDHHGIHRVVWGLAIRPPSAGLKDPLGDFFVIEWLTSLSKGLGGHFGNRHSTSQSANRRTRKGEAREGREPRPRIGVGHGFVWLLLSETVSARGDSCKARVVEETGQKGVRVPLSSDFESAIDHGLVDRQIVHRPAVLVDQRYDCVGIGDRAARFWRRHEGRFGTFVIIKRSRAPQQVLKLRNSLRSVTASCLELVDVIVQISQFLTAALQLFLHKVEETFFESSRLVNTHFLAFPYSYGSHARVVDRCCQVGSDKAKGTTIWSRSRLTRGRRGAGFPASAPAAHPLDGGRRSRRIRRRSLLRLPALLESRTRSRPAG